MTSIGPTTPPVLKVGQGGLECWTDGFRTQGIEIVFLSLFGNRNAVRGVWAHLLKGRRGRRNTIQLGGGDGYSNRFSLADGTRYNTLQATLGHQVHHLVMVHPEATTKVSPFAECFITLGKDPRVTFWSRFNRMCRVPLRDAWRDSIWSLGLEHGLISSLSGMGDIRGYTVQVGDGWTPLILKAVEEGRLI